MRNLLNFRLRTRLLLLLAIALLVGASESGPAGKTLAYFSSVAVDAGNVISTVSLSITSPSSSGVFNIASNMIPGDFQLKPIDIINGGAAGVAQQDFTYSLINTNIGSGDTCSNLDSTAACGSANPPSTTDTTGAALLLLRCTSDAGGTVLVACGTASVYVTQVYPLAGAGSTQQIAGGLASAAITGVMSNTITVGGKSFTGGQLLINGAAYPMGGPDAVNGVAAETRGLLASHTDHLAAIVYLPSAAGNGLADQKTTLTFTWTAVQRLGGPRP